jgi:hypothetical protein
MGGFGKLESREECIHEQKAARWLNRLSSIHPVIAPRISDRSLCEVGDTHAVESGDARAVKLREVYTIVLIEACHANCHAN